MLALYGAGIFRIDQLAGFSNFEQITLNNYSASSSSTVYLGAQAITVDNLGTAHAFVYLGSGAVTYQSGAGGAPLYSTSSSSWNSASVIDAANGNITLYLNSSGTANTSYDLTDNTLTNILDLFGGGDNLTLQIDNDIAAEVAFFRTSYTGSRLVTSEATLDLSQSTVSGFRVVSDNATGTTFTVRDLATAMQIAGGSGLDKLVAENFNFTAEQRTTIFTSSSVETIQDGSGQYASSAAGITMTARSGRVLVDGAPLDQWDRETIGGHVGYLPQDVQLFDGTIADNIARFAAEAEAETVIAAARSAGFHDAIVDLPDGYDTRVGAGGCHLSAGQRQRLGLARALYGEPFLVVLDEPNANLDADGEAAVAAAVMAVRQRSGIAVVVAHRPSAIRAVDLILAMKNGEAVAFGPRDEVLAKVLQGGGNHVAAHSGSNIAEFEPRSNAASGGRP